jgi:hypothetical protein
MMDRKRPERIDVDMLSGLYRTALEHLMVGGAGIE